MRRGVGRGHGMKVKIEVLEGLDEEEVIIRCGRLDDTIIELQKYIAGRKRGGQYLTLLGGETEYFVPLEDIFFFESEGREIRAHTADRILSCTYKLYELEELLPGWFMRISKSTVINLDHVYSVTRNLTASSVVEFAGTEKRTMVSRGYYKLLMERLRARKLAL